MPEWFLKKHHFFTIRISVMVFALKPFKLVLWSTSTYSLNTNQ